MKTNKLKSDRPAAWLELHVESPAGWHEALSGYLFEIGARAVEERFDNGATSLITHLPYDDKLNGRLALMSEYFAQLHKIAGHGDLPRITFKKIKDRPWAAESRQAFKPVELAPGIRVAPTWSRARRRPGEVLLRIDPGEAFGTGLHASTKLCVKLMIKAISRFHEPRVLDVGTGTGILSMIAIASGAGDVTANDIDPKAVETAAENFQRNGFAVNLTGKPVEKIPGKYHAVIANILLAELERLAPILVKKTLKGGAMVLSGLLESQSSIMKARMEESGAVFHCQIGFGGWIAMMFEKP